MQLKMIEAVFSDILTDFNCTALVHELTKFILYRKQQIPFTYDRLSNVIEKRKIAKSVPKRKIRIDASEKLYRKAECGVDALNEIFKRTAKEFSLSIPGEFITEIALMFGNSILTPKQTYRIQIPLMELGHSPHHHSDRRIMSQVLNVILSSDQLHNMLTKPLEPTNMFLLIKKSGNLHSEEWLVPKPRYTIPSFGQHFLFKFGGKNPEETSCACKGFSVFSDSSVEYAPSSPIKNNNCLTEVETWFQAPVVFKGFKDVYENGISVSTKWFSSEDL